MDAGSKNCDAERIARFLRHEMSDAELSEFTQHLDGCAACSERLESEVVDKSWWDLAEEYLADSPYEMEPLSEQTLPADSPARSLMVQQVLDHLAPTDDPQMLGRLGSYEIMGVVGSGGMGIVLKAFDPSLDRCVAVKTLNPVLAGSGAARARFSREARAAAAVVHDNVIEIYGVAEAGNLPYLVTPYVRGTSLQRRLDDSGPLSTAEVLRVGMQTAAGLAAAHAQGLVHRDIKPANILLSEGVERVLITDFGLARAAADASLTRSGVIAGTPQYMSPEQARGEAVDRRSDLFSLGSTLYAACTGRAPFRAETSYGVLRRITDEEPRPIQEINPEIPQWLCAIIGRLMAKQPEGRFASAGEVAELLEQCLAHVQQPTAVPLPASVACPSRGGGRLTRWLAIPATFAFLLLGQFLWQASDPPDIAGIWTGDDWGEVVLKDEGRGRYEGSYEDKQRSGTLRLKWSRFEQRFNGTWSEDDKPGGRMSIRLVDAEIRGGWTTAKDGEAKTPRLGDLLWVRRVPTQTIIHEPGIHVRLPLSAATYSREIMQKNLGCDVSVHAMGLSGKLEDGTQVDNFVGVLGTQCRLDSFAETMDQGKKCWTAGVFVPRRNGDNGANFTLTQERIDRLAETGVEFELGELSNIRWDPEPPVWHRAEAPPEDSGPLADWHDEASASIQNMDRELNAFEERAACDWGGAAVDEK